MQREWLEARYFIVSDAPSPDRASGLLPPRVVTVSTCIVESYPDAWALPWVQTPGDELDKLREFLGLDMAAFSALRSWVGEALDNGDYGWPNVFLSLGAARAFGHRFLGAVKNRRLVGLSMVEDLAREYLREEAPPEGHGAPGIWTALSRTRLSSCLRPQSVLTFWGLSTMVPCTRSRAMALSATTASGSASLSTSMAGSTSTRWRLPHLSIRTAKT